MKVRSQFKAKVMYEQYFMGLIMSNFLVIRQNIPNYLFLLCAQIKTKWKPAPQH